ncbi:MAG: hypothetical protein KGP14_05560 [Betaproteobacteria bacterium]|nr:hypothetical protein [Betaproteobacteria bacterium]
MVAVIAVALALSVSAPALAETVACHLNYGGETQIIESAPLATPYTGAPTAIGSFFLFRVVFVPEPSDLARINLYTHAELGEVPIPLQHASYPYPVRNHGRYGFTGLQRVYEPKRESELQYWCEIRNA